MIDLLVKVAVNAAALLAAAFVVPEFNLTFRNDNPTDWIKIAIIALVFALVNSYLKPILNFLAMPLTATAPDFDNLFSRHHNLDELVLQAALSGLFAEFRPDRPSTPNSIGTPRPATG